MLKILKNDFNYSKEFFIAMFLVPAMYMTAVSLGPEFMRTDQFASRVIWPILIGGFPIILLAIAYKLAIKKGINRVHILLPLKLEEIAVSRFLFGFLPAFGLLIFLVAAQIFFLHFPDEIFKRIIYQFGVYTLLIAALMFSYEFVISSRIRHYKMKLFIGAIILLAVLAGEFIGDMLLFPMIHRSYIGLIYFTLGAIVFAAANLLFSKRKTFLE